MVKRLADRRLPGVSGLTVLSLGKIAAGPRAAAYYTDQVASGAEDYYAGEGEAPGHWTGSAAAEAGLDGRVDVGQLEQLLAGGGLRKRVRDGAVAGFDLTFRAPKSISVLWGIADPAVAAQLGQAHDAAVEAALGYIEREACWGRRGKGGAVQVHGNGLVAAAFRHRASRAGDPLLHTHVVVGNLTRGPDGRWTALDARHLYRQAKTAGFLYQAELRREVTERLGLVWGPVENGTADVHGVERGVVEHFSQRHAEILEHMAEHGGRTAVSAQIAALETRRAKQDVNGDRLRTEWRARAAEHGLTAPALARVLRPVDYALPFAAAVAHESLTRDASVFGRAELLQVLAEAQPRGASVAELERLADTMLTAAEVVPLPLAQVPAGLTEPRFTTRGMLAIEQDLLDHATRGVRTGTGIASRRAVGAALADRALSDEQQQVVVELCGRGDAIAVLRAPAGTGKTFVLDAARQAWQSDHSEVVGCALSARAALELSDQAAIPSMTIAQLTARLDDGANLPTLGVLIVDEAGMVGTRDLARLAHAAQQARAKLVLVGDDRQLPEIQAGGAFHALAERLPVSELREVRRQREAWDRQALDALRSGQVEQWARAYRDHGQITVADTPQAARAALVNDWARATGDRLMIAARREDVAGLNHQARQLLQATGALGPDELTVAGRGFTVGDRVVGARNDRRAGLLNGQRATVTAVNVHAPSVELRLDDGRPVHLGRDYLEAGHLEHAYAITAHRAQGATVDRTFVLGGEELYREWGYTALSRHREQARFYIARPDLRPDRELPPPNDPLVSGITRLLERSNAKALALDSLPEAQREQLEHERRELRERLRGEPPPRPVSQLEDQESATTARALRSERDREKLLRAHLEQLRRRDRSQRAELNTLLDGCLNSQQRHATQLEDALGTRLTAEAADHEWLTTHGDTAARLLAVCDELHTRDTASHRAVSRLGQLDREHDAFLLAPERPNQRLDNDHDLDLDLDLGR